MGLSRGLKTLRSDGGEASQHPFNGKARSELMDNFIAKLNFQDGLITEFNEKIRHSLVNFDTVYNEDDVTVYLQAQN